MSPIWDQFRRLLLGTVVEALVAEGVTVALPSAAMRFSDDSVFNVPRFNNYMRFVGSSAGDLVDVPDADCLARVQARLARAWPDLLAVVDIPIGDRLTETRNDLTVRVDGAQIVVAFDLEAD